MLLGLYKTSEGEGITSYTAIIKVKETEKSYFFDLIEFRGHRNLTTVDCFFRKSNRVIFRKEGGTHGIMIFNDNSFILYPWRKGHGLLFEKLNDLCKNNHKNRPC